MRISVQIFVLKVLVLSCFAWSYAQETLRTGLIYESTMLEQERRHSEATKIPEDVLSPSVRVDTGRSPNSPLYRIWTMNDDESNKTVLFENGVSQFTHPHPSPDGSMIAGVV